LISMTVRNGSGGTVTQKSFVGVTLRAMRILHVNNQASVAYMISRAQRRAGHSSDVLAVPVTTQRPPDIMARSVSHLLMRIIELAPRYDLVHVHGGIGMSGVPMAPLRLAKVRFFAHYHGSELRKGVQTSFHTLAERLFVSTPDLLEYRGNVGGRELIHVPNPVEVEGIRPVDYRLVLEEIASGGRIRLSHMPSVRSVKGTRNIIEAVEEANASGCGFDLDIIEDTPVNDAISRLGRSHVCVDWVSRDYRIHGVVSLEAMARGIPAVCNIDKTLYPEEIPILPASPESLSRVLKDIWDDPGKLEAVSRRSIEYVRKRHHPDVAAGIIAGYL